MKTSKDKIINQCLLLFSNKNNLVETSACCAAKIVKNVFFSAWLESTKKLLNMFKKNARLNKIPLNRNFFSSKIKD